MVYVIFENPTNKPLNDLIFSIKEDGIQREIPALNEKWKENRCYTKYSPLPIKDKKIVDGAQLEEWINEIEWFNKDMEWLLELEHFRFWSTMVNDATCIETVISFTQEATPFYLSSALRSTINPLVLPLYSKALKNVLKVICRLITQKENDSNWMTKEYLADLLYKKYLISIPMIFDLITAYGRENTSILSHMLQTIFRLQPKYLQDLKIGLQYFQNVFTTIQRKIETDGLAGNFQTNSSLNDLALYTMDCASILSILVEILPEARQICSEIQLEQSISNFYDNTVVLLFKNIYTMDSTSEYLEDLNYARIELLKCFRAIININLEQVLYDPVNSLVPADKYLCILTECLADQIFVRDFQKHYPIENDLDILKQACVHVDNFKLEFIENAYCCPDIPEENGFDQMNGNNYHDFEEEGAAAVMPERTASTTSSPENQIEQNVRKVLDILPHLGDGFIRKILPRYDNVETTIAAILEGNLPPDLVEADQSEPYIPPDKLDTFFLKTGVDRLNIYDGDEFDVLTHDKIKGVMKKGKGFPGQAKTIGALLDDKSHVNALKSRYQDYQIVCDEYDDEYDDSYDALADSESKTIRVTAAMKNVLVDEIDDDEEDESEDDEQQSPPKDGKNFCENPELVRKRYEEQRRSKYEARPGPKVKDVVGKPKGQGQEKGVVLNRSNKNTNKSSRANHNRKQGATFKRNKGMVPS